MGVRLAAVADRDNVFDVLRIAAAVTVLLSHCFPLTGTDEPISDATGSTLGELGVFVFFAISGFLIVRSWQRRPIVLTYAIKRALRLLPALVVVSFLTCFILGPAVTSFSLGDYFGSLEPYVYFLRSSVLITFASHLPGVFAANPYPDAVNGSLWTLPVEASAYVGVAAAGVVGLLRARWRLSAPALFVLLVLLGSPLVGWTAIVPRLFAIFAAGGSLWLFRERVVLSWWAALALVAIWVASWGSGWAPTVLAFLIPYATLVVGYRAPRSLLALVRPGDVSYGFYVYAFPVQQVVAHVLPAIAWWEMLLVAAPITYLCAFLSWRLVERPALSMKRRVELRGAVVAG